MSVLGWILCILGVLFIIVGLIEAILKLFRVQPKTATGDIDWWALIQELLKAGLFNVAVGLALLVLGLGILGVDVFPKKGQAPG